MAAPLGNENSRKGRLLNMALEKALENKYRASGRPKSRSDSQAMLVTIFEGVIDKAVEGEQWAVTTILDRAYGKPKVEVEQTGVKQITGVDVRFIFPEHSLAPAKNERVIRGEVVMNSLPEHVIEQVIQESIQDSIQ